MPATWARYATGRKTSAGVPTIGRGHRLFTDGDTAKTACGRDRKGKAAKPYDARPDDGPNCPDCVVLDDLAAKYADNDGGPLDTTPLVASDPLKVPDPLPVPDGMCFCGAGGCTTPDVAKARTAWLDRNADIAAAKLANFNAYLAANPAAMDDAVTA